MRLRTAHVLLALLLTTPPALLAFGSPMGGGPEGGLPDLFFFFDDPRLTPELPNPGVTVLIEADLRNGGQTDARNFTVRFHVDGATLEDVFVPVVEAFDTVTVSSEAWVATDGTHEVRVVADVFDEVEEEYEDNNEASRSVEVKPRPDLVLKELTWEPPQPIPGDVVVFTAIVANIGLKDAVDGVVNFYLENQGGSYSGHPLGTIAAGAQAAYQSDEWVANGGALHELLLFGVSNVTWAASAGTVEESNRLDNAREADVMVSVPSLVHVQPQGDARGFVAVSVQGHATGFVAVSGAGPANAVLLAIAPLGDARAAGAGASVAGDSQASDSLSVLGDSSGQRTAITVAGDASCLAPQGHCLAFSVLGDAAGGNVISVAGRCNGTVCFAIAPTGDAEGYYVAASPTGSSKAHAVAVGAEGAQASGQCGAPCFVSLAVAVLGPASGGHAVSVADDADGFVAVSALGDASGVLPMSGTGRCNGRTCIAVDPASGANGHYASASGLGSANGGVAAASVAGPGASCSQPLQSIFRLPVLENPCVAVAGAGNAQGPLALSGTGDSAGNVAASLAGDAAGRVAVAGGRADADLLAVAGFGESAAACTGSCAGASGLGEARAACESPGGGTALLCAASSIAGDASAACSVQLCWAGSAMGDASCVGNEQGSTRCLALAALGNASCAEAHSNTCAAFSATGDATCIDAPVNLFLHPGCAAVSLTGGASGAIAVSVLGHAEGSRLELSGCDLTGICVDPV